MVERSADIVIFGAGIAGLWTLHRLKAAGYDVLLLERAGIGGGQSIASQGILHSGLKYAIAGKVNDLARSISAMPDLWRAALNGEGAVNLSAAGGAASSQYMLIPAGFMGGLVKLASTKALGDQVRELAPDEWPDAIKRSGFKGSTLYMDEPVLDIGHVVHALTEPYKDCIRKIDNTPPMEFLRAHGIEARQVIFTAAGGNHEIAKSLGHDSGLETQARPLLMGMMRPAPYPFYAHLIGKSEKPVATITTHRDKDGALVWYVGGGVAERAKDANPQGVYTDIKKAFTKYLPDIDVSNMEWSALPIDRIEGKSSAQGWLPDTPTVHEAGNVLYCWPTKLTFAPLLSDMILERIDFKPRGAVTDWSFLPTVDYAPAPWDKVEWIKGN